MDAIGWKQLYGEKGIDRLTALREKYSAHFKGEPRFFSAPGRVELGGNHTDHQCGRVIAAAVMLDFMAAAAPNGKNEINVLSEGHGIITVNLDSLDAVPSEKETSAALIRGIAAYFARRGKRTGGFDAYVVSSVPVGSGLSSSAAFEVLTAVIMDRLFFGGSVSAETAAMAGKWAENEYFGKPCGLMDQMASAVGGVTTMDFYDPEKPVVRGIRADLAGAGYDICVVKIGASHEMLTEEYAAIPNDMNAVAALMGKDHLGHADPDEFYALLPSIRGRVGDRALLRAIHFFEENDRVLQEADALERGRIDDFLQYMRDSSVSSWTALQNVYPSGAVDDQPAALALSMARKLLGKGATCRIHGGGFAGTILALVPHARIAYFTGGMNRLVGPDSCTVLSVRRTGGTEIVM